MQVVRLSHPVDGSLDLFVTLLHQFHHVGIHEINRQICTQQDDNGSKENTHEKVLIKGRPPPKCKELRGELVSIIGNNVCGDHSISPHVIVTVT